MLLSEFPSSNKPPDIQFYELFSLVLAAKIWSYQWKNKAVKFYCDNMSVVFMLIKKRATFTRPDLMQLIRILCHLANINSFHIWVEHISTEQNIIADDLSRYTNKSQTIQTLTLETQTQFFDIAKNLYCDVLNLT